LVTPERVNVSRLIALTKKNFFPFLKMLGELYNSRKYTPALIMNSDETPLTLTENSTTKGLNDIEKSFAY
jgi:hypothetical protein